MTQLLLSYSLTTIVEVISTDVTVLTEAKVGIFKRLVGRSVKFECDPNPKTWPAFVNASGFDDAIHNVVLNAKEATQESQSLQVESICWRSTLHLARS